MRIGELAQRSGVAVETIRYYEAQGLLPAPLRLDNNYRNYTRKHLARLHFIRHCRLLDMSLEESPSSRTLRTRNLATSKWCMKQLVRTSETSTAAFEN